MACAVCMNDAGTAPILPVEQHLHRKAACLTVALKLNGVGHSGKEKSAQTSMPNGDWHKRGHLDELG